MLYIYSSKNVIRQLVYIFHHNMFPLLLKFLQNLIIRIFIGDFSVFFFLFERKKVLLKELLMAEKYLFKFR